MLICLCEAHAAGYRLVVSSRLLEAEENMVGRCNIKLPEFGAVSTVQTPWLLESVSISSIDVKPFPGYL